MDYQTLHIDLVVPAGIPGDGMLIMPIAVRRDLDARLVRLDACVAQLPECELTRDQARTEIAVIRKAIGGAL